MAGRNSYGSKYNDVSYVQGRTGGFLFVFRSGFGILDNAIGFPCLWNVYSKTKTMVENIGESNKKYLSKIEKRSLIEFGLK